MNRLAIVSMVLLLGTVTATACTCLDSREHYFKKAKVIFQGTIDSVGPEDQFRSRQITFTVLKKWKGTTQKKVTLFAADAGPCAAFKFQEGNTYIIYAYPMTYHARDADITYDMFASSACGESLDVTGEYANDPFVKKVVNQLNSFWFRFKTRYWS